MSLPNNGLGAGVPGAINLTWALEASVHSASAAGAGLERSGPVLGTGAATSKHADVPDYITSPSLSNIAAPGDGRTPPTSLPPSLTGYPSPLLASCKVTTNW
jgi:hypothetical protein